MGDPIPKYLCATTPLFMKKKPKDQDSNPLILFDGICNLCNVLVQFILKRDARKMFRFASLQSESGQNLLIQYGLPLESFDTFVLIQENKIYLRSTAAIQIARQLGWIWKIGFLFRMVPRPIRDFIYSLIANNRYRLFGEKEVCMIPSPGMKDRFLQ